MLARIIRLLEQDKAVLYPAMIIGFAVQGLPKIFPPMAELAGLRSLAILSGVAGLNFFTQLFAAECARQVILRPVIQIGDALAVTLRRYIPALFFDGLLGCLFLLILLLAVKLGAFGLLLLPLLLALGLALEIFPLVYVLGAVPVFRVYALIYLYFRRNPRGSFQLFSFCISATILGNMILTLFNMLPASVSAVLAPLSGGFITVFIVYGLVLLLLGDNRISELV